jgi:hypothetical protein
MVKREILQCINFRQRPLSYFYKSTAAERLCRIAVWFSPLRSSAHAMFLAPKCHPGALHAIKLV